MTKLMDIDLSAFPIEVHDEAEELVMTFDSPSVFNEFLAAESAGEFFEPTRVRVRYMELRDRLQATLHELDDLLAS